MELIRKHLSSLVIGSLIVGGLAYAGAEAATGPNDVVLTQEQTDPSARPGEPATQEGDKRPPRGGPMRRPVRGDLVVQGRNGTFENVKIDRGVLKSVDDGTLQIDEADGTSVTVATTDQTRIRRDGRPAKASDLQAGDHVMTVRVGQDGDFVTKSVRAFSEQGIEQMRDRRQEHRQQRRTERFGGSEQQLS